MKQLSSESFERVAREALQKARQVGNVEQITEAVNRAAMLIAMSPEKVEEVLGEDARKRECVIEQFKHLKYSEEEWQQLEYVTDDDLDAYRKIVTRDGEAKWYVCYDTPDGEFMTVQVCDMHGIRQTFAFHMKYIHMWFKLAPAL